MTGFGSFEEEKKYSRELLHKYLVSALAEVGFFDKAAFLGGTALKMYRGLNRMSEDLDFSLLVADPDFEFQEYIQKAKAILEEKGVSIETVDKSKAGNTVKKAYVKDLSIPRMLNFSWANRKGTPPKVLVKLEVDSNPPAGARFEMVKDPVSGKFPVRLFTKESSFAGKCHALLERTYLKGRDWYDFLFYVNSETGVNHRMLASALEQSGNHEEAEKSKTAEGLCGLLRTRIDNLDIKAVVEDLRSFVSDEECENLVSNWTRQTFYDAVDHMERYLKEKELYDNSLRFSSANGSGQEEDRCRSENSRN